MATDSSSGSPRPFDVKTIEYLIQLMAEHELGEISLAEGEQRIRLRKGSAMLGGLPASAYPTFAPAPTPMPGPMTTSGGPAPAVVEAPLAKSNLHEIKSPMVGTFYAKAAPDKPDYVSVGSTVSANTVVCKLEAMKIFNDITADCSGTIVEICVKNSDPVDFNTVLFRVERS